MVVLVVWDIATDQLSGFHHFFYVWPSLKKKIPLAFNPVHLFLAETSEFVILSKR
jgi:hypothetical protein